MPRRADSRFSQTIRFQILLEETRDRIEQVVRGIQDLGEKMVGARAKLSESAAQMKKLRPGADVLSTIEERLGQVGEDLSRVGWSVVEASWELKRLRQDIVRLGGHPSELRQKAHVT